jgi:hypothetical protein
VAAAGLMTRAAPADQRLNIPGPISLFDRRIRGTSRAIGASTSTGSVDRGGIRP